MTRLLYVDVDLYIRLNSVFGDNRNVMSYIDIHVLYSELVKCLGVWIILCKCTRVSMSAIIRPTTKYLLGQVTYAFAPGDATVSKAFLYL